MAETYQCCTVCGFFKDHPTAENSGYCLRFEDNMRPGECMKIRRGQEDEIAAGCTGYFRNVDSMSQADFIGWRGNIENMKIKEQWSKTGTILTIIAVIIAGATLITAVEQLV